MSITSKEITQEAVAFICEWYRCIDQKEDFSVIDKQILGREITVDFPNHPMGYEGFQKWYEGQCSQYTGKHHIHTVSAWKRQDCIEIFAEITWTAVDMEGKQTELYPNVTLKITPDSHKVFYYGCVDRPDSVKT